MIDLSAILAARAQGQALSAALLVLFDFADAPWRVWDGAGPIETGGHVWSGLGELGSISGLDAAINGAAPAAGFVLTGVDAATVNAARNSWAQAKGRAVQVLLQFFGPGGPTDPLDDPFVIWTGTMERINYQAKGPSLRVVTAQAESLFTARGKPPLSWLSDTDQQRRYAGDKGLERMQILVDHKTQWPRA